MSTFRIDLHQEAAHHSLVLQVVGEFLLDDVGVGFQHLVYCLCESSHVSLQYLRVRALQLAHHLEALRQLREHVDHRIREQRMLRALLELQRNGLIGPRSRRKASIVATYTVLFVPIERAAQVLERHIVVLVQPLHHERLEPRRILRYGAFVRRHVLHIVLVVAFDLCDGMIRLNSRPSAHRGLPAMRTLKWRFMYADDAQ